MKKFGNALIQSVLAVQMIFSLVGCSQGSQNKKPELPEEAYAQQKAALEAEEQKKAADGEAKQAAFDKLQGVQSKIGEYRVYNLDGKYYTLGTLQDINSDLILCAYDAETALAQMPGMMQAYYSSYDSQAVMEQREPVNKTYSAMKVVAVPADKFEQLISDYDFQVKFGYEVYEAVKQNQMAAGVAEDAIVNIDNDLVTEAAKDLFKVKDAVETDMVVLDEQAVEHPVKQIDFVVDTQKLTEAGLTGLDAEYVYKTVYYVENEDQYLVFENNTFDYSDGIDHSSETQMIVALRTDGVLDQIKNGIAADFIANNAMTVDDIKASVVKNFAAVDSASETVASESAAVDSASEASDETKEADDTEKTQAVAVSKLKTVLDKASEMNDNAVEFMSLMLPDRVYLGNIDNMPKTADEIKLPESSQSETQTPETAVESENESESTEDKDTESVNSETQTDSEQAQS